MEISQRAKDCAAEIWDEWNKRGVDRVRMEQIIERALEAERDEAEANRKEN
jgi:hypothetical protein